MARASEAYKILHYAELSYVATEILREDCLVIVARSREKPADIFSLILVDRGGEYMSAVVADGPDRAEVADREFGDLLSRAMVDCE